MRTFYIFIAALLIASKSFAGDLPIIWKGEIRIRGEFDGRDFRNKTPANVYTFMRTRIGAEVTPIEKVQLFFQVQDARVFGEEKDLSGFNTISNTKNIDLHQAYVKVDDFLTNGLSLKLGRMELSYGNERIIGPVAWNNISRVFDGGLLRYQWAKDAVDLFVTNIGETTVPTAIATPTSVLALRDEGQLFSGLYYSSKSIDHLQLDGYALNQWNSARSNRVDDDLFRTTLGTYFKGDINQIQYEGEFAYQTGSSVKKDLSAYMLTGSVGYNFTDSPFASVALGFDYLSGNTDADTTYKAFDPAFHTGHKFYGFMDYFIAIPNNANLRGLQDAYIKIVLKPIDQVLISIWAHSFQLAHSLNGNNKLGQEIDLTGTYNYNKNLSFDLGFSSFIPDVGMRTKFGGADAAFWGYGSARVWF